MARNPNRGGSGPKVTKQSGKKGPITGNRPATGKSPTRPWGLGKGSNGSSKPKHSGNGQPR